MKQKSFYIWLFFSILVAVAIFISSSIEGSDSGAASMAIADRLANLIGLSSETMNFLVRKSAHFTVFALLAFCLVGTFKHINTKKKYVLLIAWGIASLYGILDEVHQYFVPGRVFAITDMLINSAGALFGVFIMYLLGKIKNKASKSKRTLHM